jgi:hypothetical protein
MSSEGRKPERLDQTKNIGSGYLKAAGGQYGRAASRWARAGRSGLARRLIWRGHFRLRSSDGQTFRGRDADAHSIAAHVYHFKLNVVADEYHFADSSG